MKINYVAHLDPFAHKGGGEVVLRQLIAAGKARGHEFGFRTCSPVQNTLLDVFLKAFIRKHLPDAELV